MPVTLPLRVMITGAGGFVGRHLLRQLGAELPPGSEILACDHTLDMLQEGEGLALDVTRAGDVAKAVRDFAPTHVVHLAAISAVPETVKNPNQAWDVNLYGTLNVCHGILEHCRDALLVFVGSAEVYGRSATRTAILDETTLLEPANVYAATKAAADLAVGEMARRGLHALRFRPFNHIGPGQSEAFVVPAFAAQIARIERGLQKPEIRVGNLEAARDFLDVRDVVALYARAIMRTRTVESGAIFNIASGIPRRIQSVLDDLIALSTVEVAIVRDTERMRPSDTPTLFGEASRARATFAWAPTVPWSQTLADVLEEVRCQVEAEIVGR